MACNDINRKWKFCHEMHHWTACFENKIFDYYSVDDGMCCSNKIGITLDDLTGCNFISLLVFFMIWSSISIMRERCDYLGHWNWFILQTSIFVFSKQLSRQNTWLTCANSRYFVEGIFKIIFYKNVWTSTRIWMINDYFNVASDAVT